MMRLFDPMFIRPRGLLGQLGGRVMARTNAEIERRTAQLARPADGETILVIGPGPGVGLHIVGSSIGSGRAIGIEPSATMRRQSIARCADLIGAGRVELRDATAADTGAVDGSADAVISVNNVYLWPDRDAAFAELHRVLRPGGRLVIGAHATGLRVTGLDLDGLRAELERAGFVDVEANVRDRASALGKAVELLARRG